MSKRLDFSLSNSSVDKTDLTELQQNTNGWRKVQDQESRLDDVKKSHFTAQQFKV